MNENDTKEEPIERTRATGDGTRHGDRAKGKTPCPSCAALLSGDLPRCVNCRREVEGALTRIAGRRLRKLRRLPECSVGVCTAFLQSVGDDELRLHLSAMAWWRFSSDGTGGEGRSADRIRDIMSTCKPFTREGGPPFGSDYMQRAFRALSPLTPEQITAWFGCENVYQMAELFNGAQSARIGKHCHRCRLYKTGCTAYGLLGADECPFFDDPFVQGIATALAKSGGWKDPCAWLDKQGRKDRI